MSRPACGNQQGCGVAKAGRLAYRLRWGLTAAGAAALAVVTVAALQPREDGVRPVPDVVQQQDRRGIGVVFDAGDGVRGYYILDSTDYRYMGTKVVKGGEAVGMSVLGAGIVDEPSGLP